LDQQDQMQQRIIEIFSERFDTRLESDGVDLLETGLVDSVKIVELVLEIEQRFGVSLPFEELEIEDFRTVPRLAERIARNTAAGHLTRCDGHPGRVLRSGPQRGRRRVQPPHGGARFELALSRAS
jgi:D-alanine--poly(phosphoribitol) ligase subunit 2